MLRSAQLNTVSRTKTIYRDLVGRANGIYLLYIDISNDENAFLGLPWNSFINQPYVYKLNLILYLGGH